MRIEAGKDTQETESVLGCRLTLNCGRSMAQQIAAWATQGRHGYVCVSNTHQVVQAQNNSDLRQAMAQALAVTTDSQVLANAMSRLGHPYPEPVLYGPDLMAAVIEFAVRSNLSLGLYGSNPRTCQAVSERLLREHPSARLVTIQSPPMAPLAELTDEPAIAELKVCSPDILLVSLGCPKQEMWMHQVSAQLTGIQVGLGGAFEFYAGVRSRSPAWVHRLSLEWLYRLICEPRRLLARYLLNNPRFIWLWLSAQIKRSTQRLSATD